MTDSLLRELRDSIRQTDQELVQLLNRRARLSCEIGAIKAGLGKEVYNPSQESRIYDHLAATNGGDLPLPSLLAIFREIIFASRLLQSPLTAAYLGPEASLTGPTVICIPVVASTQAAALQFIASSAGLADILELRMDLLVDGNLKGLLAALRSAVPTVQVLVTNRPRSIAEVGGEKERIAVLMEAVSLGADFVDVELATAEVWREKIRTLIGKNRNRTRLIFSHHDFSQTPSHRELVKILNAAIGAGAQVAKIVTQARTPEDNLTLLDLIPQARRRKLAIIAFCMGEQGKMSRVMAPLLGSLFTFAALAEGRESAPGQLTVHEMREIWRLMKENQPDVT